MNNELKNNIEREAFLMKKSIKRIFLSGLTCLLVMGMAVTGMAASKSKCYDDVRLSLGSKGYADCYVYAGDNSAAADTSVYAEYAADYIYAYASVELTVIYEQTGYEASKGSDWDSESNIGYEAYAEAYVSAISGNYSGISASSDHEAEIDGVVVSCSLYAGN